MKKFKRIIFLLTTTIFALSLFGCESKKEHAKNVKLTISAAASLREVMGEIEKEYEKMNPNVDLIFNLGSSGSLQKQIEQGAPSDVFISAGEAQMDALKNEGLLKDDSIKTLVKNQLVLISTSKDITNINDLNTDKVIHIAMGEPSSVPAGKYTEETLNALNIKDSINSKLVYGKDVKEVLSWIVSGEAEAGFVYKSDLYNRNSVHIIETISEQYHSPINYPVAIINSSQNLVEAEAFENFLLSDTARELFEKYGYETF